MVMNHFRTEEWIDFVNQASTQEHVEAMEKHLAAGCKKCAEQLALWQKVRSLASAESAYQPPEQAVRSATAMFSTAAWASGPNETIKAIELLFDSFLQPAYSGARTAGTGIRRMLYRADSFQIDLQIEAKPGGGRIVVTGQVFDVGRPEIIGRGLQVTLSNREGILVHALTNEFGEFHVEIQNSGDLQLALRSHPERPIVIPLKDPLGDLPGGDHETSHVRT
jgi:hypothetical protein